MFVYFGTYTRSTSQGIYRADFDAAQGTLGKAVLAAHAASPTFLALHPTGRWLYSAGELLIEPKPEKSVGGTAAYAIDVHSGKLAFIGQTPTGDGATTHVAVDATGRMLLLADYRDGYVAAVPVRPDGMLEERSAFISHQGRGPLGPNRERQDKAHAHSVTLSPDNRYAFACDLGLDRIFAYRIAPSSGGLEIHDPAWAPAPAGSGPRHSKFSPDGRFFYVAEEMGGSVSAYAYDAARGALSLVETVSTLPEGFAGLNTVGEIRLHPNGRFVYVSNRGHESIAVFARDAQTGKLQRIEIIPCGGKHPRNFELDPSGNWLLCANRDTNNVVIYRVDGATGRLTPTGGQIEVPEVVCVVFGR